MKEAEGRYLALSAERLPKVSPWEDYFAISPDINCCNFARCHLANTQIVNEILAKQLSDKI